MNQNDAMLLFKNHQWEKLANSCSPNEIVKFFSFEDDLRLAYRLLYNDAWDDNLQEYAVKLFNEIRKLHQEDWNKSWEYDALLGLACEITYNYDERYEAYKRAFDKISTPPPKLLIELARCCICPGYPPISYDDAINLILRAIKESPYIDGIGLLSLIYSLKKDNKNEVYWAKLLKSSNQDFYAPSIEPKFLVEEYLHDHQKHN